MLIDLYRSPKKENKHFLALNWTNLFVVQYFFNLNLFEKTREDISDNVKSFKLNDNPIEI